ncbi:uncharacterized protein [Typha angustifolia]|uniref:uncharacterized protein n=1 Tax=Typha angustifolia TaxID=59011 RepID=UPI003C2B2D64
MEEAKVPSLSVDKMEEILFDAEQKISRIFLDFMTKIAKFEELVDLGKRFLMRFYQEVEYFRRPHLDKISKMVGEIIRSNSTGRMKAYVEAGCNLPHQSLQNISQLHSCEQGLQDHLKRVKALLDELQCLTEDAYAIMRTTNESTSFILENHIVDSAIHEDEVHPTMNLQDKSMSCVCMIMAIYGMLKLDYAMQENIIRSLALNTPSSELESYCLMWDLRPYINDSIMRLAWKFVP